ncbi:unnamed protein product [Candidula unifasciata]|uniref:RWD domain-containing protein 3 n=1 Tax=Candidula unifasciata TaxID=100452 RepID=A0A8S3YGW9_9EUPU|nr:unnamed protein product [Candidula unifasciata]
MDNTQQEEEIESLRAIFCRDGEFTAEKATEGQLVTINFDLCSDVEAERNRTNGSVSILLTPEYPQTQQPKINIRCSYLPVSAIANIMQKVKEAAASLQGQPMLLDLCYLAQELLEGEMKALQSVEHNADGDSFVSQTKMPGAITKRHLQKQRLNNIGSECPFISLDNSLTVKNSKSECRNHDSSRTCQLQDMKSTHNKQVHKSKDQNLSGPENGLKLMTVLLQLDHMRSKNNYIKLIKKWSVALGLPGRLIFCNKLILILLQGTSQAIKEYVIMNRTTIVDVDSKGKGCKERMLTVLCEIPADSHARLSDFCVEEVATIKSLQELFHNCSLSDLYENYVSNLIHISGSRVTSSKQYR